MEENKYVTRRVFLRRVTAAGFSGAAAIALAKPWWSVFAQDSAAPEFHFADDTSDPLAEEHAINIRLPLIAEDGSNVPIVITLENHPMEAGHFIENIQMVNFRDPVVSKGVYHLSPANGQAYLSTQLRLDGGDAEIFVIAECTQHGKWVSSSPLKVSLGGC
jgi:predicted secreted protein